MATTNFDVNQFITKSPPIPQIRMGIIGKPGTGKTTAVINTFPNVIVIDFDKKLPPGINRIDMTDKAIYSKFVSRECPQIPGTVRTACRNFLTEFAPQFPAETVLLWDSWTSMLNQFSQWQRANETTEYWSKKAQEVDGWAAYDDLIDFAIEITNLWKSLHCHLVVTMHEQDERKKGALTGGVKPLMKGQFADQMAAHLTTFFRAGHSKTIEANKGYVWRVKPDDQFKPITPPGFKAPDDSGVIPATYESYIKCFIK